MNFQSGPNKYRGIITVWSYYMTLDASIVFCQAELYAEEAIEVTTSSRRKRSSVENEPPPEEGLAGDTNKLMKVSKCLQNKTKTEQDILLTQQ